MRYVPSEYNRNDLDEDGEPEELNFDDDSFHLEYYENEEEDE